MSKGSLREEFASRREENLYELDGMIPVGRGVVFGVQHFLAMIFSNILPAMLVLASVAGNRGDYGELVDNAIRVSILFAGVATAIQALPIWRFGSKIPLVVGTSFTFMGTLALVGSLYGVQTMFISLMIGSVFAVILGLFAKYWLRFIPSIVSGIVVFAVGLSLIPTGVSELFCFSYDTPGVFDEAGIYQFSAAWPYLVVGFMTLFSAVFFQVAFKGRLKNYSLILALFVGIGVSSCFIPYNNMIDFSLLKIHSVTDVINVPKPIFSFLSFSAADINIGAIASVTVIYIIGMVEIMGGVENFTVSCLGRPAEDKEVAGALSSLSLVSGISALFGSMPFTLYQQNVAIMSQTKAKNRHIALFAASLMILVSFFPVSARLFLILPLPVLGGCLLPLFGSIAVSGMKQIARCGFNGRNVLVLTLSLGLGYGLSLMGEFLGLSGKGDVSDFVKLVLNNPVAMMFFVGLISYYLLPKGLEKKEG